MSGTSSTGSQGGYRFAPTARVGATFSPPSNRRDVTDHYAVQLEWPGGFHVSFLQSWVAPADERFTGITLQVMGPAGGLDFGSGAPTYRDRTRPRQTLHPGNQADTRLALQAFLGAAAHASRCRPH